MTFWTMIVFVVPIIIYEITVNFHVKDHKLLVQIKEEKNIIILWVAKTMVLLLYDNSFFFILNKMNTSNSSGT